MKRGKPCERTSEWAQVERIAAQWLKKNWRNVQEECESMVGYEVGSGGELSPWDWEEGQRIANEIGSPYYMFVVGSAGENESGTVMSQELFEPDVATKSKPRP